MRYRRVQGFSSLGFRLMASPVASGLNTSHIQLLRHNNEAPYLLTPFSARIEDYRESGQCKYVSR